MLGPLYLGLGMKSSLQNILHLHQAAGGWNREEAEARGYRVANEAMEYLNTQNLSAQFNSDQGPLVRNRLEGFIRDKNRTFRIRYSVNSNVQGSERIQFDNIEEMHGVAELQPLSVFVLALTQALASPAYKKILSQ